MTRRVLHRITSMAALALMLITVASCGNEQEDEVREAAVRPAKLLTLTPASGVQTARYPAVVSVEKFSELSFLVSGLIEEIPVIKAQEVGEGEVIARLDQRDFESTVSSARAQFNNAEEEYTRALRLSDQNAIARSVLEQRKSQRDVARANLDSAEKALEDATLRAPFAGVIAELPARERQTVSAGQLIATLMDTSTMQVTIDLPAQVIAESQEVEDRGAAVVLKAAPDNRIEALFKEANLLADAVSQTYAVTFTFEPPPGLVILPGMNATLELSSARRSEAGAAERISVPLTALASEGAVKYVWVVDEDTMTVSRREVTIADGIGEYAIVTDGLSAGETIITAGAAFIAEGMQVRPWTE